MKKFFKIFFLILFICILLGSTVNIASRYRAIITRIDGAVLKKDVSRNIWIPAKVGDILDNGDSLKTEKDGYTELKFEDGSIVKVGANTELNIYKNYLFLAIGYIKLYITKLFPNFEVRTPSAIAGVRGTEFSVEVLQDMTTLVTVYEGEVELTAQNRTIRLRKGESGIAKPDSPPGIYRREKEEENAHQFQHRGRGDSNQHGADNDQPNNQNHR